MLFFYFIVLFSSFWFISFHFVFFLCLSSVWMGHGGCYTCALVTPYNHVGFVDRRSEQSDWLWLCALNMPLNVLTYLLHYQFYKNVCPPFASGGNTSTENNPKHDGDDGTSILGPGGELFLDPLKGNVQRFTADLRNKSAVKTCRRELCIQLLIHLKCLSGRVNGFVLHCMMRENWGVRTFFFPCWHFKNSFLVWNMWRAFCSANIQRGDFIWIPYCAVEWK